MSQYRICRYEDAFKEGFCAQVRGWWTLGFWVTVKNIHGDVIVKSRPDKIQELIPYWENKKIITPIEQEGANVT